MNDESKVDDEATALFVCCEVLKPLDGDGIVRVLEYLRARFRDDPLYQGTLAKMVQQAEEMKAANEKAAAGASTEVIV